MLFTLISFMPAALVIHCLFIFLFKRWLGPIGTFYASVIVFLSTLLVSVNELYYVLLHGNYFYLDFGR